MAEKLSKEDIRLQNETHKTHTDSPLKDKVYFWIIDRYSKNSHKFSFSDRFIWKGTCYMIPEIAGYLMFFAFFLFLAMMSFKRYGEGRTIIFVMLLIMWRAQMIHKQLVSINKKL